MCILLCCVNEAKWNLVSGGTKRQPNKITQLRTVRNVFSSLAVSLDNTHKLNNYANIYKLSDIQTILEYNNSFATYSLLENYFDNVFCTVRLKLSQCVRLTNIMWRVSGRFAGELSFALLTIHCLLACSLCFPPSLPNSLVSIHSTHWFSQCCVDSGLRGTLWLGCHGDFLVAEKIATLPCHHFTGPTLQYSNWVRVLNCIIIHFIVLEQSC